MTYQDAPPQRADHPRAVGAVDEVGGQGLRIFQALTAAAGGVLFVAGLVAAFGADYGEIGRTTTEVAGIGFSGAAALVAILLGGAILAAALADQDRGSAAVLGIVTLVIGIGGFVVEAQAMDDVEVARRLAGLFVAVGAATFALSLVPWWTARRRVSTVV